MSGYVINWSSEAIATLWSAGATVATGLAAVAGACFIGMRQAAISKAQTEIAGKQADILAKQVGLDELKLRADLFDKRFAVYKATNDVIVQAMQSRDRPPMDDATERNFLIAKDQATFLYRKSVTDDLQAVWENICAGQVVTIQMEENLRRDGEYGEGLVERELELNHWLTARMENLSELFGDELTLTHTEVGGVIG